MGSLADVLVRASEVSLEG